MRFALLSSLVLILTGCGTGSFLITPVTDTSRLDQITAQPGRGSTKVAIIEVEGMLLDDRTGGLLQPSENPLSLFIQELNQAADDDSVKAVVLRVNSPGGSVTTSDTMYQALLKFRTRRTSPSSPRLRKSWPAALIMSPAAPTKLSSALRPSSEASA